MKIIGHTRVYHSCHHNYVFACEIKNLQYKNLQELYYQTHRDTLLLATAWKLDVSVSVFCGRGEGMCYNDHTNVERRWKSYESETVLSHG